MLHNAGAVFLAYSRAAFFISSEKYGKAQPSGKRRKTLGKINIKERARTSKKNSKSGKKYKASGKRNKKMRNGNCVESSEPGRKKGTKRKSGRVATSCRPSSAHGFRQIACGFGSLCLDCVRKRIWDLAHWMVAPGCARGCWPPCLSDQPEQRQMSQAKIDGKTKPAAKLIRADSSTLSHFCAAC